MLSDCICFLIIILFFLFWLASSGLKVSENSTPIRKPSYGSWGETVFQLEPKVARHQDLMRLCMHKNIFLQREEYIVKNPQFNG